MYVYNPKKQSWTCEFNVHVYTPKKQSCTCEFNVHVYKPKIMYMWVQSTCI